MAAKIDVHGAQANPTCLGDLVGGGARMDRDVFMEPDPMRRLGAARPAYCPTSPGYGVGAKRFFPPVACPTASNEVIQVGGTAIAYRDDVIDFQTDIGSKLATVATGEIVTAEHCPADAEPVLHGWSRHNRSIL